MNIHQCKESVYSAVLLPQARSFMKRSFFREPFKLGKGFDDFNLGEAQKFSKNSIVLQEILIPNSGKEISEEEIAKYEQKAIQTLSAEASSAGWQFHALPAYEAREEALSKIADESLRLAMKDVLRVIDCLSNNEADYLHDLGAKGRRELYRTMPTAFYVFAIQVK